MIARADHHLSLYVPSRTRQGRRSHRGVTPDVMVTIAVNFFASEFGGATVVVGEGHHLHGTPPRRSQEQVHIVSAFATRVALRRHLRTLKELAADFCVRFDQESVAYEIDGVFRLVTPPASYVARNRWLRAWSPTARGGPTRAWMRYAAPEKISHPQPHQPESSRKKLSRLSEPELTRGSPPRSAEPARRRAARAVHVKPL